MHLPTTLYYDQLLNLREVLAPKYAILPVYRILAQFEALDGPEAEDVSEDYLEGVFGSISNDFSSAPRGAGKVAGRAAHAGARMGGGTLQGALSGAQFRLPGIVAGAALGGIGAGLSKYGKGTAGKIGRVLSRVTGLAGQSSGLGRMGAPASSLAAGKTVARSIPAIWWQISPARVLVTTSVGNGCRDAAMSVRTADRAVWLWRQNSQAMGVHAELVQRCSRFRHTAPARPTAAASN